MTRGGGKPSARRTLRANESTLNSRIKVSRAREAGQNAWVTPASAQRIRELVEAQICPICGDGPFKLVASHTNRNHGIDRYELRELCGVNRTGSITSQAVHEEYAIRGKTVLGDPERAKALQERGAKIIADRTDTVLKAWAATDGSWAALESLADSLGRNRKQFRAFLQNHGCAVPDGRIETTRRRTNYPSAPWRGCSVDGCARQHNARGLCELHYRRMRIELGS